MTRAGETAVVALELQEYLDYHGQPIRSRFRSLDTWIATDRGWRLIGQHTGAVLKDPPAARLTRQELCEYAGVYSLTSAIQTTIRCVEGGLTSERADRPLARYSPELRDLFFVPGQPRTRRIFTRDAAGRIDGFVDRREGEDVRWTRVAGAAPVSDAHKRRRSGGRPRVALITGAGRGIGRATAEAFARPASRW